MLRQKQKKKLIFGLFARAAHFGVNPEKKKGKHLPSNEYSFILVSCIKGANNGKQKCAAQHKYSCFLKRGSKRLKKPKKKKKEKGKRRFNAFDPSSFLNILKKRKKN